jgi:hypothetical protein
MEWGEDEFQQIAADNFEPGHRFFLTVDVVYWFIFLFVLLIFVVAAAWFMGRKAGGVALQRMRRDSVRYIYEHVQYYIDKTLKSQGAAMIDNARDLVAVIDGRLSEVINIQGQQGKLVKALEMALKGEAEVEKPKSGKVKTGMSVDEQRVEIWEAVHKFHKFWGDKTRIYHLLEMAQIELYQSREDNVERLSVVGLYDDEAPKPPTEPVKPEPPVPEKTLLGKLKAAFKPKPKKSYLRADKAKEPSA